MVMDGDLLEDSSSSVMLSRSEAAVRSVAWTLDVVTGVSSLEELPSSDALLPPPETVISLADASVLVAVERISSEGSAHTLPVWDDELSVVTLEWLLVELPSAPNSPVARVKVASGKVLMVQRRPKKHKQKL